MTDFSGRYKLIKSEHFEEFLQKFGGLSDELKKKAPTSDHIFQEIKQNDDHFNVKIQAGDWWNTEFNFTLNEEFQHEIVGGIKVKEVVTLDGNKLIHKYVEPVKGTLTTELNGNTLTQTFCCEDMTAVRTFEKC